MSPPEGPVRQNDPYQGYHFRVVVAPSGGLREVSAAFAECTGLQAETEVLEYREGGVNDHAHRFWGPIKHSPLVLKRGISDDDGLWDWCRLTWQGTVVRRTVTVVLQSSWGQDAMYWEFRDAFPLKWTGPEFHADSGNVAFHSVELAHRGFVLPPAASTPPPSAGAPGTAGA